MREHRGRARAAAPLLTLALVVGGGLAVVAATDRVDVVGVDAADAAPPEATPTATPAPQNCVVPNPERVGGPAVNHDWFLSPKGPAGVRPDVAVRRALDNEFGGDVEDLLAHLRHGLIGLAFDYGHHQLVAVVDPTIVDGPALERELREAAYDESTGADASDLTIRVGAGCHSSSELLAASQVITEREYYPDAKRWDYEAGLDANTSVYDVNVSSDVVGEALQEKLGDLVRVTCCYRPKEPLY